MLVRERRTQHRGARALVDRGVEKDLKQAVKFYKLSAEQGYDGAQNNLGVAYKYGKGVKKDLNKADIILIGVSRTSKTPTSIYLANKGFKTSNIPLVNENSLPEKLKQNPHMTCVVGLSTEPERLADLRKNRMNSLRETENIKYTDLENIKKEVFNAKKTFQKYKWPQIDVTRKSVEETAASIIKIHEIYLNNVK